MEKKYQIVPSIVEKYIMDLYNFIPSTITSGLITQEGFDSFKNLKNVWTTDFYLDKKLYTYEGLLKYPESNIFVYYYKSKDENTYNIIMLYEETSKDSVIFTLHSLTKYKVQNYENINNGGIQE